MSFSPMPWSFRWRRGGGGPSNSTTTSESAGGGEEAEELGVTPQLLDFVRSLSADTFKSCLLQLPEDGDGGSDRAAAAAEQGVRGDLTEWQERHAVLVLSKAKEIAKIRYDLCPRHMKDKQFWRMYFLLAKSYIAPYELRAIQKEKLKRMEAQNGKPKNEITIEVEMQESKCSSVSSAALPIDSES